MRAVAPILVLLLAGCTEAPLPWEAVAQVPSWSVGDSWNYTVLLRGNVSGWVRFDVEAIEPVPEVTAKAYRVRVERFDPADVEQTGRTNETRTHREHYDVANLNQVWNDCAEGRREGACHARRPEPDFPIWGGRVWHTECCDDLPAPYDHRVTALGNGTWRITREVVGKAPHQVDLYDEAVRFYRERHWPEGLGWPYAPVDWKWQEPGRP